MNKSGLFFPVQSSNLYLIFTGKNIYHSLQIARLAIGAIINQYLG